MIKKLKKENNLEIGLTDLTLKNTAALASIALSASAIEKHVIFDKNDKYHDS